MIIQLPTSQRFVSNSILHAAPLGGGLQPPLLAVVLHAVYGLPGRPGRGREVQQPQHQQHLTNHSSAPDCLDQSQLSTGLSQPITAHLRAEVGAGGQEAALRPRVARPAAGLATHAVSAPGARGGILLTAPQAL